ncbi:hypothetical protein [Kitasatospora azatica]|uniref:hypothetical protein n=1 Tax=Kitasatospora azatica TaxID=58347 RepID=UPI00056AEBAB|nr:hypothetical protein [Kitasatospora azatica]
MSVSIIEAPSLKNAISAITRTWHVLTFATVADAVHFLNLPPAQGPGEAVFSYRADGEVDLMYFL